MDYYTLTTLEILLTIVFPLLFLYVRGPWPLRLVVPSLLVTPILWYLTYSVLHELSHVAGAYLVGGTVTDYKLMPRFWDGELGRAWITTAGITEPRLQLVMTGFPYALDIVSVVAGILLLRDRFSAYPFLTGLLFMLLVLRPAFDFLCEGLAFLTGEKGDFHAISQTAGATGTWVFIVFSLSLCLFSTLRVLARFHTQRD